MTIQQEDDGKHGKFYVRENETEKAQMTYTWAGSDKFIIDHTGVDDALRGQGVGEKMVRAAVTFARENRIKILPLCPFAKNVFSKNEALRDVL